MRWLRWISGIAWIVSWRIVYLEIFRWHHLTRTLRFNPPTPPPGSLIEPRAGLPVRAIRLTAVLSPVVFVLSSVVRAREAAGPDRRPARRPR
ncbi:MAG TPA: hypothetical protein VHW44_05995 [Pseudonocardiaceae bacterium]|nr:hypothetical protein [Pseudonocardiaceae bacterium]